MRRFKVGVLVRDNRVKIMENEGIKVSYEILSDDDYVAELKKKVVEEAGELALSDNALSIKEEVADIYEVLEHIVRLYDFDKSEIEKIKEEKQRKIGKFEKRLKINSVEMADDNKSVEYYLKNAKKYPEVV